MQFGGGSASLKSAEWCGERCEKWVWRGSGGFAATPPPPCMSVGCHHHSATSAASSGIPCRLRWSFTPKGCYLDLQGGQRCGAVPFCRDCNKHPHPVRGAGMVGGHANARRGRCLSGKRARSPYRQFLLFFR